MSNYCQALYVMGECAKSPELANKALIYFLEHYPERAMDAIGQNEDTKVLVSVSHSIGRNWVGVSREVKLSDIKQVLQHFRDDRLVEAIKHLRNAFRPVLTLKEAKDMAEYIRDNATLYYDMFGE